MKSAWISGPSHRGHMVRLFTLLWQPSTSMGRTCINNSSNEVSWVIAKGWSEKCTTPNLEGPTLISLRNLVLKMESIFRCEGRCFWIWQTLKIYFLIPHRNHLLRIALNVYLSSLQTNSSLFEQQRKQIKFMKFRFLELLLWNFNFFANDTWDSPQSGNYLRQ